MQINDFIYKDNCMTYKEKDVTYHIKIKERINDTYKIIITADEAGKHIQKKADEILSFLQTHFYEHPRYRLEAITKEKKELSIQNKVNRKTYQYYTLEILHMLCIAGILIPAVFFEQTWTMYALVPFPFMIMFYIEKVKKIDDMHSFLEEEDWKDEREKNRKRKIVFSTINLLLVLAALITFLITQFL